MDEFGGNVTLSSPVFCRKCCGDWCAQKSHRKESSWSWWMCCWISQTL